MSNKANIQSSIELMKQEIKNEKEQIKNVYHSINSFKKENVG